MLLLVMMPMGISALATTELALTNKRIIGRMRKQRLTIPFEDIESVRVRRSILGAVFNYGSITIIGNGIRIRFPGITKPRDMKALIDTAVENAIFGDAIKTEEKKNLPKTEVKTPAAEPLTKKQAKEPRPAPPPPAPAEMTKETTEEIIGRKATTAMPLPENNTPAAPTYKDPNAW